MQYFRNLEKMPHKMYIAASNGAQKNRLKDMYYIWNIVFENITDNNTDLTAAL